MDGLLTIGEGLGLVSTFAVVLWRGIDIFKKLLISLRQEWVRNLPGEVWILLSIALGIGGSIVLELNAVELLTTYSGPATQGFMGYIITGFLIGTSSNVVQQVMKPVGEKLGINDETVEAPWQMNDTR